MTAPTNTVCSAWAASSDVSVCHDTSGFDPALITAALNSASDLLWRWSGYKYPGVCDVTVRPCAQNTNLTGWGSSSPFYPGGFPYGWGYGSWSWGYCACQSSIHRACGCTMLSEVRLGRAPIIAITQVKVDGLVLVAGTDYRVDDYEWLVRLPSSEQWPCCQDLSLDDSHDNTWSVHFTWGNAPPPSGVSACVDLAWEIMQLCEDGNCAPSENVSSVQRQGTSMTFIAPERFGRDLFDNLRFGIKSVDRFLAAVGNSRPGMLVSPDIDADTRRVNT